MLSSFHWVVYLEITISVGWALNANEQITFLLFFFLFFFFFFWLVTSAGR